jgi:hypothetical protein
MTESINSAMLAVTLKGDGAGVGADGGAAPDAIAPDALASRFSHALKASTAMMARAQK